MVSTSGNDKKAVSECRSTISYSLMVAIITATITPVTPPEPMLYSKATLPLWSPSLQPLSSPSASASSSFPSWPSGKTQTSWPPCLTRTAEMTMGARINGHAQKVFQPLSLYQINFRSLAKSTPSHSSQF